MADDPNTPDIDAVTVKEKDDIWSSRRKMAWVSLWGMILPTTFIILRIHDPSVLDKIGSMMSWYYLAMASIVGAYVGFKTWASIKGLGKTE